VRRSSRRKESSMYRSIADFEILRRMATEFSLPRAVAAERMFKKSSRRGAGGG
jgi:hypothetical protein